MWSSVTDFFHLAQFSEFIYVVVPSMFQHVSSLHSFLQLSNIPLYRHTTFCFFVLPLMDIWLFLNFSYYEYAMNIHMKVFVFIYLRYLCSRIARSYDNFTFNHLRNCQTVFHRSCNNFTFPPACMSVLISLHPCEHLLLSTFFYDNHDIGYEVISHYGLDLCFYLDNEQHFIHLLAIVYLLLLFFF